MDKRFWICGTVVSFAALVLTFVVHAFLLGGHYVELGTMYRDADDGARRFGWLLFAHALLGYAMTWVFARGFDTGRSTAGQGLRFGLAMALFGPVPAIGLQYAMQPVPGGLIVRQAVLAIAAMLLLGMLLAWLQPRRQALREPR